MRYPFLNILFISLLGMTSNVHAGLIGVSEILITPSNNTWLQVSEVVATQTGTGNDLALLSASATATGSSIYSPTSDPSKAIDGVGPVDYPNIFHSGEGDGTSWLRIVLGSISELDSIDIMGRAGCCTERDIYDIELFDVQGASIFSARNVSAFNNDHTASILLPDTRIPTPAPLVLISLGIVGVWCRRVVEL